MCPISHELEIRRRAAARHRSLASAWEPYARLVNKLGCEMGWARKGSGEEVTAVAITIATVVVAVRAVKVVAVAIKAIAAAAAITVAVVAVVIIDIAIAAITY